MLLGWLTMADISRRYFFFGSVLAGAVPAAGFGSIASLARLGYKSPNEKLNFAAIGAGGKGWTDIKGCRAENLVAKAHPDGLRAGRTLQAVPQFPTEQEFPQVFHKVAR